MPGCRPDCTIRRAMVFWKFNISARLPPAILAGCRTSRSRTTAVMYASWFPYSSSRFSHARIVLTVMKSSARFTMIDLHVSSEQTFRSLGLSGLPLRHTTRRFPRSPTRSLMISSMSILSFSARTTTTASLLLAFARASSSMILVMFSSKPMIMTCPSSMTRDFPRRRLFTLSLMPLEIVPMRKLVMNMPTRVTSVITAR